jgi:ABC-type transport system involved in multi-copper enzyme maturation permease subunit
METTATIRLLWHFGPLRLLGPFSEKELRVVSRRRRHYALRAGYVVLLSLIMLSAWYAVLGWQRAGMMAVGVSRASDVSLQVALRVLCFQFAATQLVAAVMLSSSISDEMRRGTLSVLLTTPITRVHIAAGKLLAGLLQVVLLLAISLPALAILRLQGGISWDLVFRGFCITLTAAVFAGALSLWLSTYCRHPYEALSAGAVIYLLLFAGLPLAATGLASIGVLSASAADALLDAISPFRALGAALPQMMSAGAATPTRVFPWPLHCLVMTALAGILLGLFVRRVRRVAAGELGAKVERFRPLRSVRGRPVAWKENPEGPWVWRRSNVAAVVAAVVLCALMVLMGMGGTAGRGIFPAAYRNYVYHYVLGGFWLLVLLRLAVSAAGSVTREKESGAWPVLLLTPLSNGRIVCGKAVGALRRNTVLLLAFFAVQTCAILVEGSGPRGVAAVFYALSRLASVVFILTMGLYFGVRLKTTTAAAAATIAAYLCVNYLVAGSYNPLFALLSRKIFASAGGWGNNVIIVYLAVLMGGAFILDTVLSVFLLRRAIRNVRRYVF